MKPMVCRAAPEAMARPRQHSDGTDNALTRYEAYREGRITCKEARRYPGVHRRDKAKFVKLIETYSKWPDATSVSISQLGMQIKNRRGATASGLSENFVEDISCRHADLHGPCSRGHILGLDIDPTPEDLLPKSPTEEEIQLVEARSTHPFCTVIDASSCTSSANRGTGLNSTSVTRHPTTTRRRILTTRAT